MGKYTFIEGVKNPYSCTLLVKGPNEHTISQLKDAIKDGLRSVQNTIEDAAVVPGAGAYEIATNVHLDQFKRTVQGKARLGVEIFANALLIIPKTLLENSGLDIQEKLLGLSSVLAQQLLLVDEVIRAGRQMGGQ